MSYGDPADLVGWTIADVLTRPAWHSDALCREYPNVNFFPELGERTRAKEICARCAVKGECFAWSMEQDSLLSGYWGGVSQTERNQLRRKLPKAS